MIVDQHDYLSPEAVELRRRDNVPPWGVHVCEVDATEAVAMQTNSVFRTAWREAARLRRDIESNGD